jgi:predicted DNA-binding transcriptional regulator YafY
MDYFVLQYCYLAERRMPLQDLAVNLGQAIEILYTNYRGETARRRVVPSSLRYGATEYHPEPQWLLDAFDVEKQAERTFAMRDVREWKAL